jgi:hypothetical protein
MKDDFMGIDIATHPNGMRMSQSMLGIREMVFHHAHARALQCMAFLAHDGGSNQRQAITCKFSNQSIIRGKWEHSTAVHALYVYAYCECITVIPIGLTQMPHCAQPGWSNSPFLVFALRRFQTFNYIYPVVRLSTIILDALYLY